jgi:hypothetical protein
MQGTDSGVLYYTPPTRGEVQIGSESISTVCRCDLDPSIHRAALAAQAKLLLLLQCIPKLLGPSAIL